MTVPDHRHPTRRRVLAKAGLAGAGLAGAGAGIGLMALPGRALAAPPPAPNLAFVMNSGGASVALIDMATHRVLRNQPTLREPSHWALLPNRAGLVVCDAAGNALFTFDPQTGNLLGHRTFADPYQIGFSPDGRLFVVNSLRLNFVEIYDATTLRLERRLGVGGMPSHLDFSPDSRWSFNSMQQSGTVVAIDLVTKQPRWHSYVGPTAAGVLYLNGRVLCCVMGTHDVAVLDPASGRVERRVQTGIGPHNLFLTPDRQTLYVTNRVGGSIAALDAASLRVKRVYPLGAAGPDDMGIAPDGKLWVALRFREQVGVLDPVSGRYETIDVGRSPHGIFLNSMLAQPGRLTAELL